MLTSTSKEVKETPLQEVNMTTPTPEDAELAVTLARPTLDALIDSGIAKRPHLAICILRLDNTTNETSLLGSFEIGEKAEWNHPYDEIAARKAKLSARTYRDTGWIVQNADQLLNESDKPMWPGGVYVCLDSVEVAVGVSGVDAEIDETIARAIAVIIVGLVKHRFMSNGEPWPHLSKEG